MTMTAAQRAHNRAVLERHGLLCVPDMDLPDDETFVAPHELPALPAVCEHGSMWCPDCDGATDANRVLALAPARRPDVFARAWDALGRLLERPWLPPAKPRRAQRWAPRWVLARAKYALPVVAVLPFLAVEQPWRGLA